MRWWSTKGSWWLLAVRGQDDRAGSISTILKFSLAEGQYKYFFFVFIQPITNFSIQFPDAWSWQFLLLFLLTKGVSCSSWLLASCSCPPIFRNPVIHGAEIAKAFAMKIEYYKLRSGSVFFSYFYFFFKITIYIVYTRVPQKWTLPVYLDG